MTELVWHRVPRTDGARLYESSDGRFKIVNANPWEGLSRSWSLFQADPRRIYTAGALRGEPIMSFRGRFPTLKAAKDKAAQNAAEGSNN